MKVNNCAFPDFYIAGFPKCGTTTISDWLSQHKEINAPTPKEPNIFAFDDLNVNPFTFFENFPAWLNNDFDSKSDSLLDRYNNVFSDFSKLNFDATPGYGISKKAIERINHYTPKAKFIFVLRHPTQRVISQYWHSVRHKRTSTSLEKHLHYQSREILMHSRYFEHIKNWLFNFNRDQFHFVILEELKKDPKLEMTKIAQFLNISEWDIKTSVKNKAIGYHSIRLQFFLNKMLEVTSQDLNTIDHVFVPVKTSLVKNLFKKIINQIIKLNRSSSARNPNISDELIDKLNHYFERENKGLSKLINKDLNQIWDMNI